MVGSPRAHDKTESTIHADAGSGGVHKVTRIDLRDDEGTRLWCLAMGTDDAALRAAVAAVGEDAQRVFDYLRSHSPRS